MKWRHFKSLRLRLLLATAIAAIVVLGLAIATLTKEGVTQEHCPQTPGKKLPHGAEIGNCRGIRGYP